MSEYKFLEDLVEILAKFIEPLTEIRSANDVYYLLLDFGWNMGLDISPSDEESLTTLFSSCIDGYDLIASIKQDGFELSRIDEYIPAIKNIFSTIKDLSSGDVNISLFPFTSPSFWESFPLELIDYLTYEFFQRQYPIVFGIFKFLDIFSETRIPEDGDRLPYYKKSVHFEKFSSIFQENLSFKGLFETAYGWGSDFNFIKFMENLKYLMWQTIIGPPSSNLIEDYYGKLDESNVAPPEIRNKIIQSRLNLLKYINSANDSFASVDLIGLPIPEHDSTTYIPVGLMFGVDANGVISKSINLTDDILLGITGNVDAGCPIRLEIRPQDVNLEFVGEDASAEIEATLAYAPPTPKMLLGSTGSTRLELEGIELTFGVNSDLDFQGSFVLKGGKLVIQASDGDGFINKILPKNPMTISFDMEAGYSRSRGFYITGGVGFEYTIPIYKTIGPIFVNTVDLKIELTEGNIVIIVAVTGGVEIGPLTAVVEKIGLLLTIELGKPGLLGNADLSLGFKPPTGIGLSIDSEGVSGGGYLSIDPPNYAGILNLSVSDKFAITAIGLLTTELPGGEKGFSLLLSLMAEFGTPIQLGYGFALYGVGGLIGINRRMNKDALIEAQQAHLLDHVLFPEDPIRNATSIIESISNIFPPEEGYYVFGPMVRLFWGGVRHLVDFDVGIFIEFGGDGLVALIGLAHALLPTEEKPIVELHMDILGIIDFGNKSLEIRSSLYNSSILEKFHLSGDMALQSNWGDNPDFVLSIGGFHPSFNPPAGFPTLKRMSISFGSNNPRVSISMYLAITTNTFQTGASADLYAAAGEFSLTAHLGFDALIQFKPFKFIVGISANASINMGDKSLFSVGLDVTLEGPNRYHIYGCAYFEVLGIDCEISFDKYFGDTLPDETSDENPFDALKDALEKAMPVFEVPSWANEGVTLIKGAESYLSPVGNIIINQNAVPLDHNLSKFGGGSILNEYPNHFTLDPDFGDGDLIEELEPAPESDFAPAQFFSMNDNEKLSSAAFEKYPSGIRIGGIGIPPQEGTERMMEFETILIDSEGKTLEDEDNILPIAEIIGVFMNEPYEIDRIIRTWEMQGSNKYFAHLVEENIGPIIKDEKFIVAPGTYVSLTADDVSTPEMRETTFSQANEIASSNGDVVMSSSLSAEISKLEEEMTIIRNTRTKFTTTLENFDQKETRLFSMISNVMKTRNDIGRGSIRNVR